MRSLGTKTEADKLARFLGDVTLLARSVKEGFTPDPGTSDLDNEQPIHLTIPLGEYRRAVRLLHELEKT